MLDSSWLIRMLEKSAATPRGRLLALFDILDDWLAAPHMRQALAAQSPAQQNSQRLLAYLTAQAQAHGAEHPEALAYQLCLMVMGALQQETRVPGCGAMLQAKQAAAVLVGAQCRPHAKTLRYATAVAVLVVAFGLGLSLSGARTGQAIRTASLPATMVQLTIGPSDVRANPVRVAALYDAIEQMRNGVCQYPQALMLPAEQRSIYLENVVGGEVSTGNRNPEELHQLVQKVECYYPPVAMTSS